MSRINAIVNRCRIITAGIWMAVLLSGTAVMAQNPLQRFGGMGGGGGKAADSLEHRKPDTITIHFRYLDSSRLNNLDSGILDFGKKIPRPDNWINLGNLGTPARSLAFTPRMQSGFDPGFHSLDIYEYTVDGATFYNTTKPYTQLGYFLASKAEQFISVFHTQNIRPNWNFVFQYRLISAPGTFQNQNSNHNVFRVTSWYQSHNKRYQNFMVFVANKLEVSENGGLQNPADLDSAAYSNQQILPVKLGNNILANSGSPFNVKVTTGTKYSTMTFLLRQDYDLGQKDSIVTDTSVIPLFYPRLRLEHNFIYTTYNYQYLDDSLPGYSLNSAYYANYGLGYVGQPQIGVGVVADTFHRQDIWHVLANDFSIYQFPEATNPQQFIKLGATLELLRGTFDSSSLFDGSMIFPKGSASDYNVYGHGEYRNQTRNKKWDIEAYGRVYLEGVNVGDYNASISLKRLISPRVGYFEGGFENANRTPSFVFNRASSFYYDTTRSTLSKENTTHIFASLDQPDHHLSLTGSYYLLSNYTYLTDYFRVRQASALFNILEINLRKQFTLYRHWKWRTNTILQQVAGSSPVHVPLLVSFNQIGYDGNFGFSNLFCSFGTEIRYISAYKADGYSPLTGQFFSQGDSTIRQRLPDIAAYLHFRIRSFTGYVRVEGLNALAFRPHGFGFYHNNFVAPGYPAAGQVIRFGFIWGFIN
ncbi:MAG TPA: putative porin [Puia sp.]|nr:putative porin [Puia sp.]